MTMAWRGLAELIIGRTLGGRAGRYVLIAGLVPLLALSVYLVQSQRSDLASAADANLASHAVLQAQTVNQLLEQANENVGVIAANPMLSSAGVPREVVLEQLEAFTLFEDVTLLDLEGRVVESTSYDFVGRWDANPAFIAARNGIHSITEARFLPERSVLVVEFGAPVTQGKEVIAVVVGRLNMERIWKVLDAAEIGETGLVVAFDRHGNVISHPDKLLLLSKLEGYSPISGTADSTSLKITPSEGADLTGQIAPVGLLDWQVAALQETSETYAPANDTIEKAVLAGVFAMLLLLAAALFSSRAIARLVQNLERQSADLQAEVTVRERAEEQAKYQATHDPLTGLANRALLKDRLSLALANARRSNEEVAVIFIDLDRFKLVNDTVGHSAGDELLLGVSDTIVALIREGDSVARVGGDEFVLVVPGVLGAREASEIAERIIDGLRQTWVLAGREFLVTATAGIAIYPSDGDDAESLLRNADTAMYRAKDQGRDTYQLFSPEMNAEVEERVRLEQDLRRAVEKQEFVLYYQPQIDTKSGRIVALEALIRWNHPTRSQVQPMEFISVAEETGLILPIGEWVLETACKQNQLWKDAGLADGIVVAVNVSARQFQDTRLIESIRAVLDKTGLAPEFLEIEVTESTAMRDVEYSVRTLRSLKELGVRSSIDDFGTGYSSLSYLKQLPVDSVKIDCSFVQDIAANPNDAAIVSAIISLADILGMTTVAEGVETNAQLEFLRERECRSYQGFLFSKPLPASEIEDLLAQNRLSQSATMRSR